MTTLTAHQVATLKPGDPHWAKAMSASKVSAVLGLSPWESPFSLWHRMAGNIPWEDDDQAQLKRGHYLEPGIREWFRDQHPHMQVDRTGTWVNNDRPWQIASPDGIALRRNIARTPIGPLECKTANNDWEWGEPGTDQVPPYYRAQAMWQMDTLGLPVCHIAVLTSFMEFREYLIEYDPEEAEFIRGAAWDFLASLSAGKPPSIDEHNATYQAIRTLHPDIDPVDVELDPDLVQEFLMVLRNERDAKTDKAQLVTRIAHLMGTARRATYLNTTIATRLSKAGGTPYVTTARGLVDKFDGVPATSRKQAAS
jgi:putative phage-type endonuclease